MEFEMDDRLEEMISAPLLETAAVLAALPDQGGASILRAACLIAGSMRSGGKLMLCGNGGSAADCQHLAAEFVCRLSGQRERPALPALALTTDSSFLTAFCNDYCFEDVFLRQVQALGRPGDVLMGVSTSGGSENVNRAVRAAKTMGIGTIALTSRGGPVGQYADVVIEVDSKRTAVIQNVHLAVEHVLCALVEEMIFGNDSGLAGGGSCLIIVTGGAGFIGSNLIAGLNRKGIDDILVVDSLQNGHKFRNLRGLQLSDYVDKEDFLGLLDAGGLGGKRIDAVFHQGACTDTMEWDGRYMLNNNYEFSKKVLLFCSLGKIPFIYASSASVYGKGDGGFREDPNGGNEYPLNVYAYSKHLFDSWVLRRMGGSGHQVAGLRYFNVFGPNEMHKGRMASMVYQVYRQIEERGYVELFKGADGVPDGGQKRDFVYVEDVVRVNLFLFEHREVSGIFNCGTGQARSFNDVAGILISLMGKGETRYIPFPEVLKDTYQSFTEADISSLRRAGFDEPFKPLEDSLECYLHILQGNGGYLF